MSPATRLGAAARVVVGHGVDHLLVTSAERRPVGILSTADVARRFAAAG